MDPSQVSSTPTHINKADQVDHTARETPTQEKLPVSALSMIPLDRQLW